MRHLLAIAAAAMLLTTTAHAHIGEALLRTKVHATIPAVETIYQLRIPSLHARNAYGELGLEKAVMIDGKGCMMTSALDNWVRCGTEIRYPARCDRLIHRGVLKCKPAAIRTSGH